MESGSANQDRGAGELEEPHAADQTFTLPIHPYFRDKIVEAQRS